tara:strand:- start:2576 stop:2881 length:306 start_codon:yes stop_codon:yes gene_type:complete
MTLTINVIDRDGNNHKIETFEGQSIAQAIVQHIKPSEFMICGGCCACGTCAVDIDKKGELPEMDVDEDALLDTVDDRNPNSRLSCQVPMTKELDGVTVKII